MTLFFWAYFTVLEHPLRAPVVVPTMWLDDWVSLTPSAFAVYISLWVYVSLAPALISNLRALLHYGVWVSALCLFCLAIFWCIPTQTPVLNIDWSLYPGLSLIKGVDAARQRPAFAARGFCGFLRLLAAPGVHPDQRPRLAALDQHPALRSHRLVHAGDPPARGAGTWSPAPLVGTLFAWVSLWTLDRGKTPSTA